MLPGAGIVAVFDVEPVVNVVTVPPEVDADAAFDPLTATKEGEAPHPYCTW